MHLADTGTYPGGIPPTITGIFSILQPDGITVNGNFTSPDVYWSGSALFQPDKELRLNTLNQFQNGNYTITYTVRAPGYTDTVLTKTFCLTYTPPSLVLSPGFDVFTPHLQVTDSSEYTISGLTFISILRSWTALINSVLGTPQTITSSLQPFNLIYAGNYYDSEYDVTLTVNPQWQLTAPNPWVTIIDTLTTTATFFAQIPPSILTLLTDLDTLKSLLDASICNCNDFNSLKCRYLMAQAVYQHLRNRGCAGDLSGLDEYVYQLEKIFNNNQVPVYVNTNTIIPAYVWEGCGGSGSVTWNSITGKPSTLILEAVVDSTGGLVDGQTSYTDARMAGYWVNMWRGGLMQLSFNPANGNTYFLKATLGTYTITFPALAHGEEIVIQTVPLP